VTYFLRVTRSQAELLVPFLAPIERPDLLPDDDGSLGPNAPHRWTRASFSNRAKALKACRALVRAWRHSASGRTAKRDGETDFQGRSGASLDSWGLYERRADGRRAYRGLILVTLA
jgi:hypothetical protein